MLGKLIKYEFKATGRVFLPLFAALLILSCVNRLLLSFDSEIPQIIGVIVSVILMAGICVISLILTLQRFRSNLLGSEGYLMMTLPVSTDSLIFSKLIVSSVWYIASFIVVMLSISIMALTDFSFAYIVEAFREFGKMLPLEQAQLAVYVIEGIIGIVVSLFTGTLLLYTCMSLSMLFNKRRGLASFGIYILIVTVLQTLMAVAIKLGSLLNIPPAIENLLRGLSVFGNAQVLIWFSLLICAGVGAVFYFTTRFMLKRRLNLQ